MDKQKLLQSVIAQLENELRTAQVAAKSSHEAATAEENRPENQYDTRALEASFLARGQAARVAEFEHSLKVLRELPLKAFAPDAQIRSGALVRLEYEGTEHIHFVLPTGAGMSIVVGSESVSVVTSNSPLGVELLGKSAGDSFIFKRGATSKEYEVVSVA